VSECEYTVRVVPRSADPRLESFALSFGASASLCCDRPGQAEGTHAGAHTDTAYAHASPQNPDGRVRPACALAPALALALALALAAHALSTKSRSTGDLDADGPCGLWLVAEPAATIAIREIRGLVLGLGLAIIRKSGNLKSLSPQ
jgi:hypothetical protein